MATEAEEVGRATMSRAEDIAAQLEMEILRATWPARGWPSHRADQQVRRQPGVMNEALRLLRDRELITVKPGPNGGVFTADQPPGVRLGALDLWFQGLTIPPLEVFESRTLLEEMFSSLALQRSGPAQHAEMEQALRQMENSARGDPRGFFRANVEFHRAIARSTGVPVLISIYDTLVTVLTGALVRRYTPTGTRRRSSTTSAYTGRSSRRSGPGIASAWRRPPGCTEST